MIRPIPPRKRVRWWTDFGECKERCNLREDCAQWLYKLGEATLLLIRPSLPLVVSLPDRCGRVDRLGGGGDLWSVWYNRCGCIHYLIRARLSHHVKGSGRSVEVCDGGPRGVPSPGVVVVAAIATMATTGIVACLAKAVSVGKLLLRRELSTRVPA